MTVSVRNMAFDPRCRVRRDVFGQLCPTEISIHFLVAGRWFMKPILYHTSPWTAAPF